MRPSQQRTSPCSEGVAVEDIKYSNEDEAAKLPEPRRLRQLPQLDVQRYQPHLAPDIDEQAAVALIETLWSIMCTFVELGWGVESVQKVLPFMQIESDAEASSDEKGAGR